MTESRTPIIWTPYPKGLHIPPARVLRRENAPQIKWERLGKLWLPNKCYIEEGDSSSAVAIIIIIIIQTEMFLLSNAGHTDEREKTL